MLHPAATAYVEHRADVPLAYTVWPVLVGLPLGILDQLGDHHNDTDLKKHHNCSRDNSLSYLLLDDHVPEGPKCEGFGRLGGDEGLRASRELDGTGVDIGRLLVLKEIPLQDDAVVIEGN